MLLQEGGDDVVRDDSGSAQGHLVHQDKQIQTNLSRTAFTAATRDAFKL